MVLLVLKYKFSTRNGQKEKSPNERTTYLTSITQKEESMGIFLRPHSPSFFREKRYYRTEGYISKVLTTTCCFPSPKQIVKRKELPFSRRTATTEAV